MSVLASDKTFHYNSNHGVNVFQGHAILVRSFPAKNLAPRGSFRIINLNDRKLSFKRKGNKQKTFLKPLKQGGWAEESNLSGKQITTWTPDFWIDPPFSQKPR